MPKNAIQSCGLLASLTGLVEQRRRGFLVPEIDLALVIVGGAGAGERARRDQPGVAVRGEGESGPHLFGRRGGAALAEAFDVEALSRAHCHLVVRMQPRIALIRLQACDRPVLDLLGQETQRSHGDCAWSKKNRRGTRRDERREEAALEGMPGSGESQSDPILSL